MSEGNNQEKTATASRKFQILEQVSGDRGGQGKLTDLDLHTTLALTKWMNADLSVWRPQKLLAKDLGLSETGVRNSIYRLIKRGHLKVLSEGNGRGHSTTYQFTLKQVERCNGGCTIEPEKVQPPLQVSSNKGATAVEERCNGGSLKGATAVAPNPYRETVEESVEENTSPPLISLPAVSKPEGTRKRAASRPKIDKAALEPQLSELLMQYPKTYRTIRPKALANLATALRKGEFPAIMQGAMRYAAECENTEEQFIAGLQNWLRDERWTQAAAPQRQATTIGHHQNAKAQTLQVYKHLAYNSDEEPESQMIAAGGLRA